MTGFFRVVESIFARESEMKVRKEYRRQLSRQFRKRQFTFAHLIAFGKVVARVARAVVAMVAEFVVALVAKVVAPVLVVADVVALSVVPADWVGFA